MLQLLRKLQKKNKKKSFYNQIQNKQNYKHPNLALIKGHHFVYKIVSLKCCQFEKNTKQLFFGEFSKNSCWPFSFKIKYNTKNYKHPFCLKDRYSILLRNTRNWQ